MPSRCTFVCWPCRKVVKHAHEAFCPECGADMVNMGKRWKPPRRTQSRKWKQQEDLWRNGYRPDGVVDRWREDYSVCRWCGERDDAEHGAKRKAACQPARRAKTFYDSIIKGKKR